MGKVKELHILMQEIDMLEKSEELLREVMNYIGPYDHEINGHESGDLARRIHKHLNEFDDGE